ncbi:MAG: efflux RND transporter periplasmic adaptor subunit [Acidobacteriota bacterium]
MRRIPRWLVLVVLAAAVVIAIRMTVLRPDPLRVETARVERGTVEESVTNTRAGTIKARLRAKLSPQLGGRVVELPFREGETVRAGDLLLRLDDSVPRAHVRLAAEDQRVADARASEACLAAELAEREWRRGSALEADGISSRQLVDTLETERDRSRAGCQAARAAQDQARARLRLAEAELALTEVRAPFAGVLAERGTEVGEWITPAPPGVPIPPVLDVIDPGSVYVSAPIDEIDAERVRAGLEVRITVDSRPGESFPGRLTRVAPFVLDVLEQNRTVEVEADFGDPAVAGSVLPGTSADVEVILSKAEGVVRIPSSAIGEGNRILVLGDGRLAERVIVPGLRNWRFTEVREGLDEGELVVTARGSTEVKAGARAEQAP